MRLFVFEMYAFLICDVAIYLTFLGCEALLFCLTFSFCCLALLYIPPFYDLVMDLYPPSPHDVATFSYHAYCCLRVVEH